MSALTSKEILEGLRKIGISTFSELRSYFRDYKLYYSPQKMVSEKRKAVTGNINKKSGKNY